MKSDKINKLKMIKIWEILSQETDEDHPMTTNDLLSKLQALGIDCNRKTLYADIDALNEFGYEIMYSLRMPTPPERISNLPSRIRATVVSSVE